MTRYTPVLPPLLLCIALCIGCQGSAPEYPQQWGPITFDTPVPFSAPEEAGVDAVRLRYPSSSNASDCRMELTLVLAPKEYADSFTDADELLANMTGVFLGLTTYEPSATREFMGAPVAGWSAGSTVPRVLYWRLHLVPLVDGSRVLVALARSEESTQDEADHVLETVARSFRENAAGASGGE